MLADEPLQDTLKTGDDVVEVQQLGLEDLTPAEGQQLVGKLCGPRARLLDELDVAARGIVAAQARQEEVGATSDYREQVVEVVRHPARQPPDGFQAVRLAELILQRPALCDIA